MSPATTGMRRARSAPRLGRLRPPIEFATGRALVAYIRPAITAPSAQFGLRKETAAKRPAICASLAGARQPVEYQRTRCGSSSEQCGWLLGCRASPAGNGNRFADVVACAVSVPSRCPSCGPIRRQDIPPYIVRQRPLRSSNAKRPAFPIEASQLF